MRESQSFAGVLYAWRRLILRATLGAAVIAVGVSLLLPRWYSASATMMPPRESATGGGILQLMSQLGGDLGVGGSKAARRLFSRNTTTELMLGILQSRRLRGQVVDRFGLVEIYDVKGREHAIKELDKHLVVDTTPEGLVRVSVEDRDPERAAAMTNAFLEFLDIFNRQTSVEAAHRTVEFIDSCIEENRARQGAAAESLRRFQETHGAVEISGQTKATVEALAELQAERIRLDVRRGVLENYASRDTPELQRIESEIRELDKTIAAMRGVAGPDSGAASGGDVDLGALLPLGEIPRLGLEYANLKREVMVQERVYEFLAAQYEDARIQETEDQETIQFLDEAVPPIRKARPRRSLIVILSTILAFLASVGAALAAQAALDHFDRDDPETAAMRQGLGPVLGILERLRSWGERRPRADDATAAR